MDNKKLNIITFREIILPRTETFIENQTSSLKHHLNHYVGLRRPKKTLKKLKSPTLVMNNRGMFGFFREMLFKRFNFIPPSFIKKLKRINPKLCHSHFGPDSVYALKISQELNIPLIVTFHGYDATTLQSPTLNNNQKQKHYFKHKQNLIKQAKLFIAVSSFIKDKLIAQGYPCEKILIHRIGIDTEFFKPNNKIQRQKIVLFVGRLVEKKGCSYLIEAMSLLKNKKIKLIIIGDGPLRGELEKKAKDCSIDSIFLGHQPSQEVKNWMMRAKILCVPSITANNGDAEGFGMVFVEAQALETPVVSFKSGGIRESVAHLKSGLLAKEKDIIELSKHIDTLLTNDDIWQQYSKKGRKIIIKDFNLETQTKELEKTYHHIIDDFKKT